MSRRACLVVVLVMLYSAGAAADPDQAPESAPSAAVVTAQPATPVPVTVPLAGWTRLHTPSHVVTEGGSDVHLPAGYFFDEPTWQLREQALKDLQDDKTRLTAENASFRKSAASWQPGWVTIALAVASGLAGGWYVHSKFGH